MVSPLQKPGFCLKWPGAPEKEKPGFSTPKHLFAVESIVSAQQAGIEKVRQISQTREKCRGFQDVR
jgi:hypothetical protein